MLLRSIRAELMKCRRSPVWLAFVVLPLFPAILGTVNYLGNLEVLKSQWYSLWTQHVLFASLFFLPAQLGVFCAWQWRLEHTDHNWNQAMTAPVPARDLYLAKLVLAAGVSFLAQAAIGALFVLSGKLLWAAVFPAWARRLRRRGTAAACCCWNRAARWAARRCALCSSTCPWSSGPLPSRWLWLWRGASPG